MGFEFKTFFAERHKSHEMVDIAVPDARSVVSWNLTEPVAAFEFDFQNDFKDKSGIPTRFATLTFPITQPGVLHGLVYWFEVCMDADCTLTLDNKVGSSTHWGQMLVMLPFSDTPLQKGSNSAMFQF